MKFRLETNDATLAGHAMHDESEVAGTAGALGVIDLFYAAIGSMGARGRGGETLPSCEETA